MSLNTIPGFGKSGMSRISARRSGVAHRAIRRRSRTSSRCLRCEATAARFSSASTASLRRSGLRERRRRGEDLLQQRRLALGGGLEHAQVAPRDAVARQLGDRADDLALRLVVVALGAAQLALDDPVVLELGDQPRLRARLLHHVLRASRARRAAGCEKVSRRSAAPGPRVAGWAPTAACVDLRLAAAPGGQLLADHPQRQELVALQPQDRAQARDVGGGVEPVAAGRAPRREQLLVLQVADLRDRDVRELLLRAPCRRRRWSATCRCPAAARPARRRDLPAARPGPAAASLRRVGHGSLTGPDR